MNGFVGKIRVLKYKLKHDFLTIENVVLVVAIGLCLVWTYQSVVAMSRNWELAERLTAEKRRLELLSVEVETMELENAYYATEEYQELAARKYLDKKFEGEEMVVLPKNSERALTKYQEIVKPETEQAISNIEKWILYLFPNY